MKRSEALAPLSRDHHQVLYLAMRLKRAEDADLREDALAFFDGVESNHFDVEEQVLLPGWLHAAPGADRALAARVADEHLDIRTALRTLRGEVGSDELNRFGELLESHARFEERVLFPAIEADLDAETLDALGAEIVEALGGDRSGS